MYTFVDYLTGDTIMCIYNITEAYLAERQCRNYLILNSHCMKYSKVNTVRYKAFLIYLSHDTFMHLIALPHGIVHLYQETFKFGLKKNVHCRFSYR